MIVYFLQYNIHAESRRAMRTRLRALRRLAEAEDTAEMAITRRMSNLGAYTWIRMVGTYSDIAETAIRGKRFNERR